MKKVNLKYIGLVVFVLLVVGIPVIMDKYIIGNNLPSNIDNSDWVSFLGSYIGALLGGVFTFVGIKMTLYNGVEKKKQRDMLALQLKLTYKDIKRFVDGDSESRYPIHQFLIDKNWPDRIASIHSNISEKDFQNIYMWFSCFIVNIMVLNNNVDNYYSTEVKVISTCTCKWYEAKSGILNEQFYFNLQSILDKYADIKEDMHINNYEYENLEQKFNFEIQSMISKQFGFDNQIHAIGVIGYDMLYLDDGGEWVTNILWKNKFVAKYIQDKYHDSFNLV